MVLSFCTWHFLSLLSINVLSFIHISINIFQKHASDKPIITLTNRKGNNSVITYDRATVLAFPLPLTALYQCIMFHLIPFNTLKAASDKLIIAKTKKGSNSVITCNRVTVHALTTISDGHPSMYWVTFEFF